MNSTASMRCRRTTRQPAEAGDRAYVCSFDTGAFASLDVGDHAYTIGEHRFEMTFAAIDLKAHKAQVTGDQGLGTQGAVDAYASRGVGSTFFLLQMPSGGVILTSIVDADAKGRIQAVTSRHIVSQTLGTCVIKN